MCAQLTSDAEQEQNQAGQDQREGGRKEAAEDRALDRPHCVLRVVCICVSWYVCVRVHVWSMALLWPWLLCHRQTSTHTLKHALRFVLNCNTADTCRLLGLTTAQSDRSGCLRAALKERSLCKVSLKLFLLQSHIRLTCSKACTRCTEVWSELWVITELVMWTVYHEARRDELRVAVPLLAAAAACATLNEVPICLVVNPYNVGALMLQSSVVPFKKEKKKLR